MIPHARGILGKVTCRLKQPHLLNCITAYVSDASSCALSSVANHLLSHLRLQYVVTYSTATVKAVSADHCDGVRRHELGWLETALKQSKINVFLRNELRYHANIYPEAVSVTTLDATQRLQPRQRHVWLGLCRCHGPFYILVQPSTREKNASYGLSYLAFFLGTHFLDF